MQLVIDILLIGVFAFLVFRGWWRGFMKSVLSLGRLALSFVITILFGSKFAGFLDQKFINPPIYKAVTNKLLDIAGDVKASAEGGVEAFVEKVPETFRQYLNLESVDASSEIDALAVEWSRTISDGISGVVSAVVGYILLFVIAFVLLTVVIAILSKIADLPVISSMDKLLGLAAGVVSGVVAVMLISAVLGAILSVSGQEALVDNSIMLKLFSGVRQLFFKQP